MYGIKLYIDVTTKCNPNFVGVFGMCVCFSSSDKNSTVFTDAVLISNTKTNPPN